MSIRDRTGVIRLEVGDNGHYMILTVSALKDSNPYNTAPKAEALPLS